MWYIVWEDSFCYRKKISFCVVIFLFSCYALIFAQNREHRPSENNCGVVIESLRVSQSNDSVAIEVFKEKYEIVNMCHSQAEWLLRRNHIDIIQFFALEENKKYYCRLKVLKRIKYDPILLVD